MINKQKPTKVTKEDIELAEEISRVTTIKSLLGDFAKTLDTSFSVLTKSMTLGFNPVTTFIELGEQAGYLQRELQIVQVKLLQILGQVDEEDAHELADPEETELIDAVENLPELRDIDLYKEEKE